MASIYLYKTSTIPAAHTVRYEISNFNDVNITMDQPVSPMALPQESARENVLVKMEGNTETVTLTWRIPNSDATTLKKEDAVLTTGQIAADADGTTAVSWDTSHTYTDSSKITAYLLEYVQGKNISDRYFLKLPDQTIREGFITKMNFTISSSSPVVWSGSITFITGNVISIYDADTPSEPRSVSAAQDGSNIRLRWQAPSDTSTSIAEYIIYRKDGEDGGFLRTYELTDSGLDVGAYKEYQVTGLTSGVVYSFKITAANTSGEGLKSSEVQATFP
jgi:hypothetical protein